MAETDARPDFDRPLDQAAEATADPAADAAIELGSGMPHESEREFLSRLANGARVPPPEE